MAKGLSVDLDAGEGITTDGPAEIRLERKSGRKVRLRITADSAVKLERLGKPASPHTLTSVKDDQ